MKSKNKLLATILILTICSIAYRLIVLGNYSRTSLMFVGLPALCAFLVVKYTKKPTYKNKAFFYSMTLFLLCASIILGEGTVCILFASPIFYGIGGIIVWLDKIIVKKDQTRKFSFSGIIVLMLVSSMIDYSVPSQGIVIEEELVIDEVVHISDLNQQPNFKKNLPSFFEIGFPMPQGINGEGLNKGDLRKIDFLSSTKGLGTLELMVKDKTGQMIVFEPVSDNTHVGSWLRWKEAKVELQYFEGGKTLIKWTSKFDCRLSPSWYFVPIERYAVGLMNEHLIKSYFPEAKPLK
ncbi:hypothetical protein [Aureibacter tunicatorum]|uniref:Polyketide cyclase/dehydrase/lipid transport protein n=1 Tax=Aureibacter tunicatorum TaxID=866807 RepID=A0AAE4BT13_9BACT|nr:hypothetical protein [Aureibacter tunicatorum]MDR6240341.1 hypothetical protein [Aureibacter tunicatorum]BDD05778.1 hypothetical protein AUTU_32610 [Aureibacter tunicatorum]